MPRQVTTSSDSPLSIIFRFSVVLRPIFQAASNYFIGLTFSFYLKEYMQSPYKSRYSLLQFPRIMPAASARTQYLRCCCTCGRCRVYYPAHALQFCRTGSVEVGCAIFSFRTSTHRRITELLPRWSCGSIHSAG